MESLYSKIFFLLFIMISIIDSANGFFLLNNVHLPISIGQVYRLVVVIILLVIILEKVKKNRLLMLSGIVLYFSSMQAIYFFIYQIPSGFSEDILTVFRLLYIIIIVEAYKSLKDRELINYSTIEKIFKVSALLFPISILIPRLLGVGFVVYETMGVGFRGFYNANNAINVVLLVLLIFTLDDIFKKDIGKNSKLFSVLNMLMIIICTLLIGSKSSLFLGTGIIIFYILSNIQLRKLLKSLRILVITSILGVLFSLFIITNYSEEVNAIIDRQLYYIEVQDSSSFILSSRNLFLGHAYDSFLESNSPGPRLLFGVGHFEKNREISAKLGETGSLKAIEMDLFDIFFAYGVIGTIIIYTYFLGIFIRSFRKRNKKDNLFKYHFSFVILLIFSTFGGHVLFSALSGSFLALICCRLSTVNAE